MFDGINVLRRLAAAVAVTGTAAALSVSCVDTGAGDTSSLRDKNVVMGTTGMTRAVTDNTQVYVFDGENPGRGNFDHRVLQITRAEDELSMSMPEGIWDMALVGTATGAGTPVFLQPTAGQPRSTQKMFELTPVAGVLPQAPELVMARVDGVEITPNVVNRASASLIRNVGMVRLTIKEPDGLSTTATQKVSIGKVPTTLNWDGHLMPGKNNPTLSTARMQGTFTIANTSNGQTCSTMDFLVPAHRGGDVLASAPTDFSPNLLDVGVELTMSGGGTFVSTKEIPVAPLAGKILQIYLIIGAELDIESDIIEWTEETAQDIDIIGNPLSELRVSKTRLELRPTIDNMTVTGKSGGVNCTPEVEVGNDWLSWAWGSSVATANNLDVLGDPETYDGSPRSTNIYLVVNNFKKKIPVTQQHLTTGSIASNLSPIVLTPVTTSRTVSVSCNPSTPGWKISTGFLDWYTSTTGELYNVTLSTTMQNMQGTSGQSFTATRKAPPFDNGNYSMYGNSTFKIHNRSTLQVANVEVHNIFMRSDDISVSIPNNTPTQTHIVKNIDIWGGSTKQFSVISTLPQWIQSATCIQNPDVAERGEKPYVLQLVVLQEPAGMAWQTSSIRVRNLDAYAAGSDYYIDIPVSPGLVTTIPNFDHLLIQFKWQSSYDADVLAGFTGNSGAPFDDKPLGWSQNICQIVYPSGRWEVQNTSTFAIWRWGDLYTPGAVNSSGQATGTGSYQSRPRWSNTKLTNEALWVWSGDAKSGAGSTGESLLFNASQISDDDTTLPRKLKIELYARWYTSAPTSAVNQPITVTYTAYKGGTMTQPGNTGTAPSQYFQNTGGQTIYTNNRTIPVSKRTNNQVPSTFVPGTTTWRSTATSYYDLMCTITYDRTLNTVSVVWKQ